MPISLAMLFWGAVLVLCAIAAGFVLIMKNLLMWKANRSCCAYFSFSLFNTLLAAWLWTGDRNPAMQIGFAVFFLVICLIDRYEWTKPK